MSLFLILETKSQFSTLISKSLNLVPFFIKMSQMCPFC